VQVPVYNTGGEVVRNIEISDELFGVPFNEALVHQAMVRQRADARQGTHDTKGRGEVAGSGKKLFHQKHTGEARAGDKRSPIRRGGGVAFGPHPRDHRKAMPKKMRQLALRCLLSSKVSSGGMKILDKFVFEAPKTKEMIKVLGALETNYPVLIVTSAPEELVIRSARNIPGVKTLPASTLNALDLLNYDAMVITEDAVRKAEELWAAPRSEAQEENKNESV
jgi:large subunit ribosomal protein L4